MSGDGDFYEDDEPIEDVLAAFNAGPVGFTSPPYDWVDDESLSREETLARYNALEAAGVVPLPPGCVIVLPALTWGTALAADEVG